MAHIGRLYKLWFRRDFTLNGRFHDRGYPEAYVLGFRGISSEFWRLDRLQLGQLLINKAKEPGILRRWDMELTHSFPRIRAQIEVLGDPTTLQPIIAFRVFNSSTFRILDLRYQMRMFDFDYQSFQSGVAPEIVVKDTSITIDPDNNLVGCNAADWASYNP